MTKDIQIESSKINEQVSHILNSVVFKRSQTLSKFLQYIVNETINGNEQFLKEYVIATKVLDKNSDFNPQLNSIVRIHAQRLRDRLSSYYKNEGIDDTILISIPKGRYIPVFEIKRSQDVSQLPDKVVMNEGVSAEPIIAVMPFAQVQHNERASIICSVMKQDLSIELSKFIGIHVISNYSINMASENQNSLNDFLTKHNVSYLITGSCYLEDDAVKCNIELNYRITNNIIWAQSYIIDDYEGNNISCFRPIIRKTMGALCGQLGLIYRNELSARQPSDYEHLFAVYCHNRYHLKFSEEAFHEALKAATVGLEKNPQDAMLLTFKAEIFLNMLVLDIEGDIDFLKVGTQLAKKSVELDDNNQHGYNVLAWSNVLNKEEKAFCRSAEKCLQINPNNAMKSGAMGFGYICIGNYEKGYKLMSESILLNPYYELSVTVGFVLYYIYDNQLELALDWAERINRKALVWDILLRVSIRGLLYESEVSEELKTDLFTVSPKFAQRARKIVSTFIFDKELQNKIVEGLVLAGIDIQD